MFGPLSWLWLTAFLLTGSDLDLDVRTPWRLGGANKMGPIRSSRLTWAAEIRCMNSIAIGKR